MPTDTPGHHILYNHWTFNMPSDHAEVELKDVRVPDSAILHKEGEGLVRRAALRPREPHPPGRGERRRGALLHRRGGRNTRATRIAFGEPLSKKQAIQFPLVELYAECEMLRNFIFRTAWQMDRQDPLEISDMVSICNFRANRLCCEAADRAMQIHGGIGYSRALPFEHIYRHHRRYRITEGAEEIQMRRVAQYLFGFGGKRASARLKATTHRSRRRFRDRPRSTTICKAGSAAPQPTRVVERTQGGMSNPTYFLTRGDWRAVLRKQPNAC